MSLPTEPHTRLETYLAKLAGQDVEIPDTPVSRIECYLEYLCQNGGARTGAAARNAIFGGKSLGGTLTSAQRGVIADGTFRGLSVGDYWEMSWSGTPVKFRIAGFDLLLGQGETPMAQHHAVLVPDKCLGSSVYSDNDFTGGYPDSGLKAYITTEIVPGLESLFGTLVSYNIRVATSTTTTAWIVSKADALSAFSVMGVYPSQMYVSLSNSLFLPFPLFMLAPWFIPSPGYNYWLQEVTSTTGGVVISSDGRKATSTLPSNRNIRPFFLIG